MSAHSYIVRVAKMRAPRFPPPLWGRDRDRGGDDAPSARLVPDTRTTDGFAWRDLSDRRYEPEAALLYPSPCPSPTRGEGTLWYLSALSPAMHPRAPPRCVHAAVARKRDPVDADRPVALPP